MSELTKKEFISGLKWTWVICLAALAYYLVAPRYSFDTHGIIRMDRVSGETIKANGFDETGKLKYAPEKPTKKK